MVLERFRRVAAAVAAFAAVLPAAASLKGWRDGPVRYLLTPAEYRDFGRLGGDDARQAWIERFWEEIETARGAASGDFRRTYEDRCRTADERYATPSAPGWASDRGRVFILLGEPSLVQRETGGLKAVETEVWVYGDDERDDPPVRVAFYRCANGDYRLGVPCPESDAPPFGPPPWDPVQVLRPALQRNPGLKASRTKTFVDAILAPTPAREPSLPSSAAGGAPAAAPPPAPADRAEDEGGHTLEATPYFFRAEDGSVLTILSLEVTSSPPSPPGPGPGRYAGAATIEPGRGSASAGRGGSIALRESPGGTPSGTASLMGAVYLEPGRTYGVRYAVEDASREALLVRSARLTVPDVATGLSASSVVPAAHFGPAEAEPDGAFRVGSEEIVPQPGAEFARSGTLRLYLQVYGAAARAETGEADLDVVFRFYLLADGRERKFRKPVSVRHAARASMGLDLPLADWTAGSYRVGVDLHDRVTGERVGSEARFRVVDR